MPQHISRPDQALSRFRKSLNCSQAVLETFAPSLGMEVETARRVAAGLAGGMGRGADCGAVTGGLLVLGLRFGKTADRDPEADRVLFEQITAFTTAFRERHGGLECSGLLGVDMAIAAGVQEAETKGFFDSRCPEYVRSAAEILDRMLSLERSENKAM